MAANVLVPVKRSGDRAPIFFVPAAGTTALSLVHLSRSLKSCHPAYAFELTELPICEEPTKSVEEIASLCIDEIRRVQGVGPYLLGGHCWGGAVAFEIAAKLEAIGDRVAGLILMEAVPPYGSETEADRQANEIKDLRNKAVSELCDQVRNKLSQLPPEVAERFGRLSWQLIDAALSYRASRRIEAPLLLIRTPTHPRAVFQDWCRLSGGSLEDYAVPGDAFSILRPPVVKTVASKLDEALERYRGG